jgi:Translation initiation factor eIF3 subunit
VPATIPHRRSFSCSTRDVNVNPKKRAAAALSLSLSRFCGVYNNSVCNQKNQPSNRATEQPTLKNCRHKQQYPNETLNAKQHYTTAKKPSIATIHRATRYLKSKMADNWDDDDNDEWDVDDDELDQKLGIKSTVNTNANATGNSTNANAQFDDEEDLAVIEKARLEKASKVELAKKGRALLEKKAHERAQQEEEELVRKALLLEAAAEASMSPDELRAHQRNKVEEADHALTNDLFGAVESVNNTKSSSSTSASTAASSSVSTNIALKDMKDHLKYARTVATALSTQSQVHWTTAFYKEALQQSSTVLDEDAIADLIKTLNVMKNDKVAAAKRKVKGQAQKSKKVDKVAEIKARKIQTETFGDNDQYDKYDTIGEQYEDDFF